MNMFYPNPFGNFFTPFSFGNNYYNNYNNYYPQPNSVFYNRQPSVDKGKMLFQNALLSLPEESPNPPMCARYVKNAIVNTGLGQYMLGNGEETKYMLRANPNFREVIVPGEKLKDLPVGTVITYDAFDSGIGQYGHVVIKGPDDTAVSDRFEESIIPSDNAHVFLLA